MTININTAVLSVGIALAGLIIVIIGKLWSMSSMFGRIMQRMDTNEKRAEEDRNKNSEKFTELYSRTDDHSTAIATILEKIDGIKDDTREIKEALKVVQK